MEKASNKRYTNSYYETKQCAKDMSSICSSDDEEDWNAIREEQQRQKEKACLAPNSALEASPAFAIASHDHADHYPSYTTNDHASRSSNNDADDDESDSICSIFSCDEGHFDMKTTIELIYSHPHIYSTASATSTNHSISRNPPLENNHGMIALDPPYSPIVVTRPTAAADDSFTDHHSPQANAMSTASRYSRMERPSSNMEDEQHHHVLLSSTAQKENQQQEELNNQQHQDTRMLQQQAYLKLIVWTVLVNCTGSRSARLSS